jgi:hypothetical protein
MQPGPDPRLQTSLSYRVPRLAVFRLRNNDDSVSGALEHRSVDFHPDLIQQLGALTDAVDEPGTDLQAILGVLTDDLAKAVPSILGLDMTLATVGTRVTLTTMNADLAGAVRASLQLPLVDLGALDPAGTVTFYASTAGAFAALAADTRETYHLDGQVRLDQHLTPTTTRPGMTGLTELDRIKQAIGILIDQGHTPDQADAELRRRAGDGE